MRPTTGPDLPPGGGQLWQEPQASDGSRDEPSGGPSIESAQR
jgi:hypothetical protein